VDGIQLELLWSNLRSVVTEQAKAMQRIAFSPVVRESGDLAYGLFDAQARMVAQADTGTPGHINCLAHTGGFLASRFAGTIKPGDVMVCNDPWEGAGHGFDITIFAPIFRRDRLIGFIGSTNHHVDIGGRGAGIGALDVHEEGIWIPPLKLFEEGRRNETLFEMVRANSRTPDVIVGDLSAQVATALSGGAAVNEICDRYGLDHIDELSEQIIARSEHAMRESIRKCPSGTWTEEVHFDIPNGDVVTLRTAVKIDNDAGDVIVDFAGSSPQSLKGVNVVLNYAHAYTTCAVRSILNPEVPNNKGSMAPIKIKAPLKSIVNCQYPAPVAGRHIVGMYVPMPIMKAFYRIVPEKVVAPGVGSSYAIKVTGTTQEGRRFFSTVSGLTGGMGARATKPGLDAVYYPAGVGSIPLEIIEAEAPIVFLRREIRRGSGGEGRCAGGNGQIVEFRVRTNSPWTLDASPSSRKLPPEGLGGGSPGQPGSFKINGEERLVHGKSLMSPDDIVFLETAGAGGYGAL
jgi:N-methylhydantoinase B